MHEVSVDGSPQTVTDIPISAAADVPITAAVDVPISAAVDVPISAAADVPISAAADAADEEEQKGVVSYNPSRRYCMGDKSSTEFGL